jgi:hypothetical protein
MGTKPHVGESRCLTNRFGVVPVILLIGGDKLRRDRPYIVSQLGQFAGSVEGAPAVRQPDHSRPDLSEEGVRLRPGDSAAQDSPAAGIKSTPWR